MHARTLEAKKTLKAPAKATAKTLPAKVIPKLVAAPQRTEPMVKTTSAKAKTRRAPKRSANQPLTGMNMASVRM